MTIHADVIIFALSDYCKLNEYDWRTFSGIVNPIDLNYAENAEITRACDTYIMHCNV